MQHEARANIREAIIYALKGKDKLGKNTADMCIKEECPQGTEIPVTTEYLKHNHSLMGSSDATSPVGLALSSTKRVNSSNGMIAMAVSRSLGVHKGVCGSLNMNVCELGQASLLLYTCPHLLERKCLLLRLVPPHRPPYYYTCMVSVLIHSALQATEF